MKPLTYVLIAILIAYSFSYCSSSKDKFTQDVSNTSNYFTAIEYQKPETLVDTSVLPQQPGKTIDTSILLQQPQFYIRGKDTITYKHNQFNYKGKTYYLVEGDMLLTPEQFYKYKYPHIRNDSLQYKPKLFGRRDNDTLVRWRKGTILTYAVVRQSFGSQQQYEIIVRNMEIASREWEELTNIKFVHVSNQDNQTEEIPIKGESFVVVGVDNFGTFFAKSFFPDQKNPEERVVLIDSTFFTNAYDKLGMCRHEIGHILGFLHEQYRSQAPLLCDKEIITGFYEFTDYDSRSVMHYPCGGAGSNNFTFSDIDKIGARIAYSSKKPGKM